MAKQVRWGTVSVLEFRVGYNPSMVPESGGPPVGLVGRPLRHSYSMVADQQDEAPRKRSKSEMWVNPTERARILHEENAFELEDVALICSDVRAALDFREYSKLDHVAAQMLRYVEQATRADELTHQVRYAAFVDTRKKVVLY